MKKIRLLLILFLACCCSKNPTAVDIKKAPVEVTHSSTATPQLSYRIKAIYPHDRTAFTQGLVIDNGTLYEGTGLWGHSSLRRVDLETGAVLQQHNLDGQYFGEGIAVHDDRIVQLTYRAGKGFFYNRDSFEQTGEFSYSTEGWGLTHDGSRFIMSDGSSALTFRNLETLEVTGQVDVYDHTGPVTRLNELEYINGQVYANVWLTDNIVMIDPLSGQVTGRIDFSGLLEPEDTPPDVDVLNGIAYDHDLGRLYVTGKDWPKLFWVELTTTVDYHFPQPGMYLVSVPLQCDNMNAYDLFPNLNVNGVYEWDAVNKQYIHVSELAVGKAYWLSVSTAATVTLTGVPVDKIEMNLTTGWNLVGIPFLNKITAKTNPPNAIVSGFIGYDSITGVYLYAQKAQKTKGYWVAATQSCSLTLNFPTQTGAAFTKALTKTAIPAPPKPPKLQQNAVISSLDKNQRQPDS